MSMGAFYHEGRYASRLNKSSDAFYRMEKNPSTHSFAITLFV